MLEAINGVALSDAANDANAKATRFVWPTPCCQAEALPSPIGEGSGVRQKKARCAFGA